MDKIAAMHKFKYGKHKNIQLNWDRRYAGFKVTNESRHSLGTLYKTNGPINKSSQ